MKLHYLSVGADAKTVKGQKKGVLTGILYMAPHTIAGGKTLCPFSTAGCRAVCLYTAGRGGFNMVQAARINKSREYQADPVHFVNLLADDIMKLVNKAKRDGMVPAVRLNGTTDILWEESSLMEQFDKVQHYDYTKWPATRRLNLPSNYHLTYSWSEKLDAGVQSIAWAKRGVNTAVVFAGGLPTHWTVPGTKFTRQVIDGDLSDLRFTDPKGVIVGLKTKGSARRASSGLGQFVQAGV
jgi:hypothetical protein